MSMIKSRALAVVAGLSALLLSACSTGDGNSLKSIVIAPLNDATLTYDDLEAGGIDADAYLCVSTALSLYGLFSQHDSVGAFQDRAEWSSSNPAIAKVSNGSEPVPGEAADVFYSKGVVVPVAPGTVTITAKYLDMTASIPITVKAPTNIVMEPLDFRMAPNTRQGIRVTALLDGIKQDISGVATVAAFEPVSDTVATVAIDTAGPVVTALATSSTPLNLAVTLPVCGQTLNTTVRVAAPQSLALQHEAGFSGDLVVNTNESLKTLVNFGDGPEQDVTTQASYSVDVSTDATATDRVTALSYYATASAAGAAANVVAKCCLLDRNDDGDTADDGEAETTTSNPLAITPVAATLTSFAISPLAATVEQYSSQQFTAMGTFDGGARTQPITRFVNWSVSSITLMQSFVNSTISSAAGLTLPVITADRITANSDPITITAALSSTITPSTAATPLTTTLVVTSQATPAP